MTNTYSNAPTKRQYLRGLVNYCGLTCRTYSPGDGITRYRFFAQDDPSDYFGPSTGLGTALGISEAIAWLEGYRAGRIQGMRVAAR